MNLETLQRTMAQAVMMPLTAGETMRPQARDGRPMAPVAATFIAPNSRLTAFDRLEIYNRQYWFRVLEALREDFPALEAVLGSRRFHRLSEAYLDQNPSTSFSLRNLGARMAEWMERNPRFAGRRQSVALDVARIEWAQVEAFDSAERPPLTPAQTRQLGPDSRLSLQPHLRLLALRHPVDDLVLELHRKGRQSEELPAPSGPLARRGATWLAAHRVENSVYYRRLEAVEYAILKALGEGSTLGQALEQGFARSRVAAGRRPALISQWFNNWATLGWLCAPQTEERTENS